MIDLEKLNKDVRVRCPQNGLGTVLALTDVGKHALIRFDNVLTTDGSLKPNESDRCCWRSVEFLSVVKEPKK